MCPDCEARAQMARDALREAKFAEALGQLATGAAELVGLKPKTGAAELEAKADSNDAPSTPALPGNLPEQGETLRRSTKK